ncbi:MAG: hypothetical protein ACFCUW_15995 [Kiloniellaceae bacterium]
MTTAPQRALRRRTTAAALKLEILAYLAEALPAGWIGQPLAAPDPGPGSGRPAAAGAAAADILVISPRGRCHFLFVRAPADRWWDGGPRSVPAESFTPAEVHLARQLRAAGHRARAVWSGGDLSRALESWGCRPSRPPRFGKAGFGQAGGPPVPAGPPARPTLRLKCWGRRADA